MKIKEGILLPLNLWRKKDDHCLIVKVNFILNGEVQFSIVERTKLLHTIGATRTWTYESFIKGWEQI